MKARIIALFLLAAVAASASAAPFSVSSVYVEPATGLKQAAVREAVDRAIDTVRTGYIAFFPEVSQTAGIKLKISLLNGPPRSASISAERAGMDEESVFFYWSDMAELEVLLAPTLFSLWAKLSGLAQKPRGTAPEPSLEVSLVSAGELYGASPAVAQSVASIAPAPDGGLFVSGIGYFAELGPDLAVRGRYTVDPANPYAWLYHLVSSSSGNVLGVTSTGDVLRLKRGAERFERMASIGSPPVNARSSQAGALVYQDTASMGFVSIDGRKKTTVAIGGTKPTMMTPFDIDEDGLFWSYDYLGGFVRSYRPDGSLSQAIRVVPMDGASQPTRMHVRGSEIILSSFQGVMAYDRFGLPLWSLDSYASVSDPTMTSMVYSLCVGSDRSLFIVSMGSKLTVTRYDDGQSLALVRATRGGPAADALGRLIEYNRAVIRNPDGEAAYAARAAWMDGACSMPVVLTFRAAMGDAYPDDERNGLRLADIRRTVARSAAADLAKSVYAQLERFGAETARTDYQKAMAAFERYLADNPGDADMAKARARLGEAFRAKESGTVPFASPTLRLEAAFKPLFPAFAERYRTVPAGTVKVTNAGTAPVSGISLSVEMKTFMDYPAAAKVDGSLAPGASVEVPVFILFNRTVLDIRDELSVQVSVSASSETATGSAIVPVTLRSRTALTWDDTAALAAFVTPSDDTIVAFAHAAVSLSPPPLFGRSFSKAFAVVNALAARGFTYVEDPVTPFSSAGLGSVVDTVRFPRATLASGAGDCDDTTALLASCLEAVGVQCAILTTPGHVLLAFRADGPPGGAAAYEGVEAAAAAFGYIERDGAWWIALESTVLSKGFAEVWRAGYSIASKAGAALEIVPLADARKEYPSMPLPGTPALPPVPAQQAYAAASEGTIKAFRAAYADPIERAAAKAAKGKDMANAYNDFGVRLAQFGDYAKAIDAFRKAVSEDKTLAAPRINLVGAFKLSGDLEAAAFALASALKDLPGSPSIKRFAEREGQSVISGTSGGGAGLASAGASGSRGADAGAFEFDWGD